MNKKYTQYESVKAALEDSGEFRFVSPDGRVYEEIEVTVEHGSIPINPQVIASLLDLQFAIDETQGKHEYADSFLSLAARAEEFELAYIKVRDLLAARRPNGKI